MKSHQRISATDPASAAAGAGRLAVSQQGTCPPIRTPCTHQHNSACCTVSLPSLVMVMGVVSTRGGAPWRELTLVLIWRLLSLPGMLCR